jgi:tripartite-type tricarboxylate transporter receptor subunit TctC
MNKNRQQLAWLFALWVIFGLSPADAQEPYYKGKVVKMILGHSPGGGYDTYTRIIGRHIGKYLPGNPPVVVENMTGAGSLISANHNYNVAKPDGLTIGHFSGGLIAQQLLGQPGIRFDARKFEYLGAPAQDNYAIGLTRAAGITSVEKWLAAKTPVKLGGTAPGGASVDIPKLLAATLGLPIQVISGYKGTADIRLAAENGEVSGFATGWESFKSTWRKALETGDAIMVIQVVPKAHPELPNVPLAIKYARSDEAKKLIQLGGHDAGATARPYVLAPGTPKERVQMVRQAFDQVLKDPDLIAEAKKANLDIEPVTGEQLQTIVDGLFKVDPALINKWKQIVASK